MPHPRRRVLLLAGGLLTGCLGSDDRSGGQAVGADATPSPTPSPTVEEKDTLTATPTGSPTEQPTLRGARSGDLPGELVGNDFPEMEYEVIFARYDDDRFEVGVFGRNTAESDIGQLKAVFTLYSGNRTLATRSDYVTNVEAGTREKLDAAFQKQVDVASRWTLAVRIS